MPVNRVHQAQPTAVMEQLIIPQRTNAALTRSYPKTIVAQIQIAKKNQLMILVQLILALAEPVRTQSYPAAAIRCIAVPEDSVAMPERAAHVRQESVALTAIAVLSPRQ